MLAAVRHRWWPTTFVVPAGPALLVLPAVLTLLVLLLGPAAARASVTRAIAGGRPTAAVHVSRPAAVEVSRSTVARHRTRSATAVDAATPPPSLRALPSTVLRHLPYRLLPALLSTPAGRVAAGLGIGVLLIVAVRLRPVTSAWRMSPRAPPGRPAPSS